jgi:hypothetical protein
MADDATTSSFLPVALIQDEKFQENSIDVNVSQRSCKEESIKRVVHTRVV